MNYLHSLVPPIVHRDLRSPNVFLVSLDPDSDIIAKVMLRFYSDAAVVVAAAAVAAIVTVVLLLLLLCCF